MQVLRRIYSEFEGMSQLEDNGGIALCGLSQSNSVEFFYTEAPSLIKKFEYHFDYKFDTERINEIFNEDVVNIIDEETAVDQLKKIKNSITRSEYKTALGSIEIEKALDGAYVDRIIIINADMPENYIQLAREKSAKIFKIVSDNDFITTFAKDFNSIVAVLRFSINMQDLID